MKNALIITHLQRHYDRKRKSLEANEKLVGYYAVEDTFLLHDDEPKMPPMISKGIQIFSESGNLKKIYFPFYPLLINDAGREAYKLTEKLRFYDTISITGGFINLCHLNTFSHVVRASSADILIPLPATFSPEDERDSLTLKEYVGRFMLDNYSKKIPKSRGYIFTFDDIILSQREGGIKQKIITTSTLEKTLDFLFP